MPEKSWKRVERKVAELLGGARVPVTGRGRGSAPDVSHPIFAIEVKSRSSLSKRLDLIKRSHSDIHYPYPARYRNVSVGNISEFELAVRRSVQTAPDETSAYIFGELPSLVIEARKQAEASAREEYKKSGTILVPLVVIHRKGTPVKNALCFAFPVVTG